ncbi:MAG: dihydrofolate reductase family protein [Caulobacteraceae bacterium]
MRELHLKMSMTLDGFVGDLEGSGAWRVGGDQSSKAWAVEVVENASLHIMGSRSFRDMAPYWAVSTDDFAAPMNRAPKTVFSRQGPAILAGLRTSGVDMQPYGESWAHAQVAGGDLVEEIARMKAVRAPKPILAHGGAAFARSLLAEGLVDQLVLGVHPIVLGQGEALFSELTAPMRLKLISSKTFPGGVMALTYRPGTRANAATPSGT